MGRKRERHFRLTGTRQILSRRKLISILAASGEKIINEAHVCEWEKFVITSGAKKNVSHENEENASENATGRATLINGKLVLL